MLQYQILALLDPVATRCEAFLNKPKNLSGQNFA